MIGVVLGSAFDGLEAELAPHAVPTAWGAVTLHRAPRGWVLFRHGLPHRWLPNQIPWRAHAAALAEVGVQSLLVTSSVGLLQPDLPLDTPLVVDDLVWLDNRLPDGTAATMFTEPTVGQGHLVLEEGLFSRALTAQVESLAATHRIPLGPRRVRFWYAPGPRTKTAAENAVLAGMGLDVNSMTLAPEVVLANELGITCAAVVTGHKPSGPGMGEDAVRASLVRARTAQEALVRAFLSAGESVPFANHLYRYGP
ncbi:MAG: 5'-methylthioadenosine phosphorylase [Alphaproteobacteria bacterium]|nr:5'-methylthioadenosine phosphorylase [Alphaproteobacteria bacterium]